MYKQTIGLVGGFGAYATLNFYKRILEVFASDSEINYPRIIMDNNFTMPSRTRALLYDENVDVICQSICDSVKMLEDCGADKIIMVCGTAHYFYDSIIYNIPTVKDKLINIIEKTSEKIQKKGIKKIAVIAAEGALKKHIYNEKNLKIKESGIFCPSMESYTKIRYFIESVKCNRVDSQVKSDFKEFVNELCHENGIKDIILGCTEFPVLWNQTDGLNKYTFWDPLEIVLQELKEELY